MSASRMAILHLYKQMLKESKKFPCYSYRMYALRRINDGFREHKLETDPEKINQLISFANKSLEIIKRQVIIGTIYSGPELIIERSVAQNPQ